MRRQFSYLASARLIAAAIQAISLIFVARLVSVYDFGTLSAVLAAQMTLLTVASFGVTPFVLREFARGNFGHVKAALRLNVGTSIIAGAIAAVVTLPWMPDTRFIWSAILLAAAVALNKNIESQLGISIAQGSKSKPSVSVVIRAVGGVLPFLLLTAVGAEPVIAYSVGRLIGSVFGSMHVILVNRGYSETPPLRLAEIMPSLWPLALSNSIGALRQLDTVVVTAVAGPASAGLYAAATRVLSPVTIVASAMSSVIMPSSSKMAPGAARSFIWKLSKYNWLLTLATIPLTLGSEIVMRLVFGTDYSSGAGALSWLLVSLPAACIAPVIATVLQAQGYDRLVVANTAVLTPMALLAAAIGAAVGGPTGAGVGFAVLTWIRILTLSFGARRLR